MQVIQKVVIKGIGRFVGNVEGKDYDNGQVFIEEPMDPSNANLKGWRTVEYKTTSSEVVKPVWHLEMPITAEVVMNLTATKRGQSIVIESIKPLDLARPMPKAA